MSTTIRPLSPQEIAAERRNIIAWALKEALRQIRALKAENARLRGEGKK